jgi:hypothetical protein
VESYPPPAEWLPSLAAIETSIDVLVHVSAVAQTVFVVLWLTLPWWREWVGRALMIKSVALALFLDFSLINHYAGDYAWRPYITAALFALVTAGIVSQVIALPYEMWSASRDRRRVYSTGRHDGADGDNAVIQRLP